MASSCPDGPRAGARRAAAASLEAPQREAQALGAQNRAGEILGGC